MQQEKQREWIQWHDMDISISGYRICMIKQAVLTKLANLDYLECQSKAYQRHFAREQKKLDQAIGQTKDLLITSSNQTDIDQLHQKVALFERLKECNQSNVDQAIDNEYVSDRLKKDIQELKEIPRLKWIKRLQLKLRTSEAYIRAKGNLEIFKAVKLDRKNKGKAINDSSLNDIHQKVDTILKGTENDPTSRAQFDHLINGLAAAFQSEQDEKSSKGK